MIKLKNLFKKKTAKRKDIHIDVDDESSFIAEKTGIGAHTVSLILELEMVYLALHGITDLTDSDIEYAYEKADEFKKTGTFKWD